MALTQEIGRLRRPRHPGEVRRQALLRALTTLSGLQRIHPEFLHRLRIDLRRLEAWLALQERNRLAEKLNLSLAPLSPLRTLHVLEAWLVRHKAPSTDIRKVRTASSRLTRQLARNQVAESIKREVEKVGRLQLDPSPSRRRKIWEQHEDYLARLLRTLRQKPKRKQLHDLRLRLKRIRYQLEQLPPHDLLERRFLTHLRQAQNTLGIYEERVAFKKLAKELDLSIRTALVKRWKRARKRARALPEEMDWLLSCLKQLRKTAPSGSDRIRTPPKIAKKINTELTAN